MIKSQLNPFDTIIKATNKLVDMCKLTFGPAGSKVILPQNITGLPEALDDGVSIAKKFESEDEFENMVISLIKQVAIKTNDRVGDGTTGSLIILQAILNEIQALGKIDGRKITQELKKAAEEAKQALLKQAKKVKTIEELEKVARISFDDPKIAKVIADMVFKIGADGVVAVQESNTLETQSEIVEGFDFEKGYTSPYMVTNQERGEADLEKPVILLTDYRISVATEIIPILTKIVEAGYKNIVIIAEEVSGDALAISVVNKMQGKFNTLCVSLPGFDDKVEFLEDLAAVTGGTIISQSKGNKLADFELSMLGTADRVVSKVDHTTIIGGKGKKGAVKDQIAMCKVAMGEARGPKLERLQVRLGRLVNGVALIKVGAATEHEMRSLKYKVEDAVNAVRVAYKSGIVCGGGLSLGKLETCSRILNAALKQPAQQLLANSGIADNRSVSLEDEALNVVTGKTGNYLEVGVIDPVEVLIAGIESAVSIACLLIQTTGILVEKKEEKNA